MHFRGTGAGRILAVVLTALVACPVVAADPVEASVRQLRRAVTPVRNGEHLLLLSSLRQLRDPALEPLLLRLVQHEDWPVQVHAVLGLAELRSPPALDPWLVTQIFPQAQEAVITNAVDMGLLGPEQMTELLQWDDLDPMARLLVSAELILLGREVDGEEIARLAAGPNLRLAGLAAALLARTGDPGAFSALADRVADLTPAAQRRHVLWLIEVVRQYRIEAALPWVQRQLDAEPLARDVEAQAIFTLLQLDPAAGVARWRARIDPERPYLDRVRYGLMLLAAGPEVPVDLFDRLGAADDDPLLRLIVANGRARAAGSGRVPPMIELLDLGHRRAAEWAMSDAAELPAAEAARVYAHLIDHVDSGDRGRSERVDLAVTAATRLFEADPDHALAKLREAEDDGLAQQAILLGLFEARAPAVGAAAAGLRRIGSGQADSLALLLMAKHDTPLASNDLDQLARIASGGGRVSAVMQVQAAWLYLAKVDRIDHALAAIFFDASP